MSAWVQVEVEELPDFAKRNQYTMYKLPNGQVWVPNNMGRNTKPTHWVEIDDYLDELERSMNEKTDISL